MTLAYNYFVFVQLFIRYSDHIIETGNAVEPTNPSANVCDLPVKIGPCSSGLPRWFFNSTSRNYNIYFELYIVKYIKKTCLV